jgi:predicted RNA-binding Zn ribbon-like protein
MSGLKDPDLELVVEFVNTRQLDDGSDRIGSPDGLDGWLRDRGLAAPTDRATSAHVWRAQELREALRGLLLRNNEVEAVVEVGPLEEVAVRARLGPSFSDEGTVRLEPRAGGVDAALGRVVAAVSALMADGRWARVKACRADDCQWAFVDRARNRSRAWCSMQSCGNREKARSFRRRRAAEA